MKLTSHRLYELYITGKLYWCYGRRWFMSHQCLITDDLLFAAAVFCLSSNKILWL